METGSQEITPSTAVLGRWSRAGSPFVFIVDLYSFFPLRNFCHMACPDSTCKHPCRAIRIGKNINVERTDILAVSSTFNQNVFQSAFEWRPARCQEVFDVRCYVFKFFFVKNAPGPLLLGIHVKKRISQVRYVSIWHSQDDASKKKKCTPLHCWTMPFLVSRCPWFRNHPWFQNHFFLVSESFLVAES